MNVEELLDMLEETLEEGTAVPFAAAKRVVDVDRCRDIVDEVRNNLPDELRDSKKIVADREQILKNAQTDADNIIKQAEERARVLVSDKEITKRAQKMAVELVVMPRWISMPLYPSTSEDTSPAPAASPAASKRSCIFCAMPAHGEHIVFQPLPGGAMFTT